MRVQAKKRKYRKKYNRLYKRYLKYSIAFFSERRKYMDKEKKAIERLKSAAEMSEQYYEKPLIIAYSGGKDNGK